MRIQVLNWGSHSNVVRLIVKTAAEENRVDSHRVFKKEAPDKAHHPDNFECPQHLKFVIEDLFAKEIHRARLLLNIWEN